MTKKLLVLMVALLAIVGTRAAQLPPMHKTAETASWRLTLQSAGASKITVITLVKEHLGLGMKEAKDLVDSAPCVLLENSYYEPAKAFYDDLVDAGATATLIDTDPEVAYTPPTYIGVPTYNVVLENAGPQKLEVVKVVKNLLGIGLKEAKDLVDSAPCTLLENVDYETAAELFNALAALGATVQMVPVGEADPADPSGTWMTTVWNATSNASLAGVLRDELGLTLSDAYALISSIPAVVLCGVSYEESIALTKAINNSGYGKAFTMRLEDGNLPSPSDVVPSDVTINSANISWTAGGTETKWIVRYGLPEEGGESDGTTTTLVWDFEDPELEFDGWTSIDADGDGNDWFYNHEQVHTPHCNPYSGEGVVCSASYDNDTSSALTPDNWLVSPQVPLGGEFKFWAAGQDAFYCEEHFAVFVSTGGNTDPADFVQVSDEFVASDNYEQFTIDLSDFTGEGYIAIRHFNVTDMFMLNIDDISYEVTTYSASSDNWQYVLEVTENPYTLAALQSNNSYVVQVMALKDACNNVSGWSNVAVVKTQEVLAPSDLYCFSLKQDRVSLAWTPQSGESRWHVRYWKEKEADESFEGDYLDTYELPYGWKAVDADGSGSSWWSVSGTDYSHSGNGSVYSEYNTGGDNWLIMEDAWLRGIFTFWAKGYYATPKGSFAVYASTTDDNLESFVQISPTWNYPTDWTSFAVDLENLFHGESGYIAIRQFNGVDNYLFIDDVSFLNGHFEDNVWIEDWNDRWNVDYDWGYQLTDLDMNSPYCVQVRGKLDNGEYTPWTDVMNFKTWSDIVFMSDGDWNEADCWFNEEVPPADVDVIIAAECDIPAGYTAQAKGITMGDANGLLTLKEGAQLKYYPEDWKRAWIGFERTFKANTYYYLRVPQKFYFPDEMLEGSYTIEYFSQKYGWVSISPKSLLTYVNSGYMEYYNYRYRRTTDLTIDLRGTPPPTQMGIYSSISTTLGATYEGYNLVGNTYTCDAWLCYDGNRTTLRPYWVMNDEGEFVEGSGPIAPLQAVFVKSEGPKDNSVYFAVEEPIYDKPVATPTDVSVSGISGTGANVNWTGNGGEVKWNVRYRESDNGTWQTWDFESDEQGWTFIDGDGDGKNWYQSSSDGYNSWKCVESFANTGTDNWLISPKVDLGGIFTFWARSLYGGYSEHFTVYTSSNNFNTSAFQQASQEFKTSSTEYQQFSVDLSDINASGMGYISIRHHNSDKSSYLMVDDITYMTYPESGYIEPGSWTTVNSIGSMFYGMKGLKPQTRYDVQVQAVFEGEGRVSEWSPTVQFTTGEGVATGVDVFDATQSRSTETYDLQGRRVNSKPQQGIYLRKGHKFVVK